VNRRQALAQACGILTYNNIHDALLEGEILLRHVLGRTRAQLFSDLNGNVSPSQLENMMKLVARRVSGEPSAYIIGRREFYSLDFKVDKNVLIPRPETELLVEKAIGLCRSYPISKVADIGTGCGAIAISLSVSLPEMTIYATDISSAALEVARENGRIHGVTDRIILLQGDMLEPLPEPVDMVIANLPYVRKADMSAKGPLSFEPELALNGGEEGLDKIKTLCGQVRGKLNSKGILLLEIGQGQAEAVTAILHKIFPLALIEVERDLAGIERVICLRLT
jgi:release factor glutamine methyltransferase